MSLASDQGWPHGGEIQSDAFYWNNRSNGTIMKWSLSGGAPLVVASGQGTPSRVVTDATHVYWGRADGNVMRVSKSGGPEEIVAAGQGWADVLVADCCIFWSSRENGTIMKLAK